jgi:hypothetical protein
MHKLWRFSVAISVFGLGLAGCLGRSLPRVTGTVQENGKAIQVKEDEECSIAFHAMNADANVNLASGDFDRSTGAFRVHSPEQEGIPPGEYKISITFYPQEDQSKDRFANAFSEENTPLRYTVTDIPVQEVVVDVGKKSVTKK